MASKQNKSEDHKLKRILDQDSCVIQENIAQSLAMTQAKRLNVAGVMQKQGN